MHIIESGLANYRGLACLDPGIPDKTDNKNSCKGQRLQEEFCGELRTQKSASYQTGTRLQAAIGNLGAGECIPRRHCSILLGGVLNSPDE